MNRCISAALFELRIQEEPSYDVPVTCDPPFPPRYEQVKQQYDLKCQEAELLKTRLEQSSHHQQLEEINMLQKSIGEDRLNFLCCSTDSWGPWDYHRIDKDSDPFSDFCLVFSPYFPTTSPLCYNVLYAFFLFLCVAYL